MAKIQSCRLIVIRWSLIANAALSVGCVGPSKDDQSDSLPPSARTVVNRYKNGEPFQNSHENFLASIEFYSYASALLKGGQSSKAIEMLDMGLKVFPWREDYIQLRKSAIDSHIDMTNEMIQNHRSCGEIEKRIDFIAARAPDRMNSVKKNLCLNLKISENQVESQVHLGETIKDTARKNGRAFLPEIESMQLSILKHIEFYGTSPTIQPGSTPGTQKVILSMRLKNVVSPSVIENFCANVAKLVPESSPNDQSLVECGGPHEGPIEKVIITTTTSAAEQLQNRFGKHISPRRLIVGLTAHFDDGQTLDWVGENSKDLDWMSLTSVNMGYYFFGLSKTVRWRKKPAKIYDFQSDKVVIELPADRISKLQKFTAKILVEETHQSRLGK